MATPMAPLEASRLQQVLGRQGRLLGSQNLSMTWFEDDVMHDARAHSAEASVACFCEWLQYNAPTMRPESSDCLGELSRRKSLRNDLSELLPNELVIFAFLS